MRGRFLEGAIGESPLPGRDDGRWRDDRRGRRSHTSAFVQTTADKAGAGGCRVGLGRRVKGSARGRGRFANRPYGLADECVAGSGAEEIITWRT